MSFSCPNPSVNAEWYEKNDWVKNTYHWHVFSWSV